MITRLPDCLTRVVLCIRIPRYVRKPVLLCRTRVKAQNSLYMPCRALIPRMPTLFYSYTYTLCHATSASPASSLLHTSTNERRRVLSGCRPVTFTAGRWRVLAGRGHGATRDRDRDRDVYELRDGCDLTQEGIGSAYVVVVRVGSRAVGRLVGWSVGRLVGGSPRVLSLAPPCYR